MFTFSDRPHIDKIKEYLQKSRIKVILGYPREPSQMPCIAVMQSEEQEIPIALGENEEAYIGARLGITDDDPCWRNDAQHILSNYINLTTVNSTTKIGIYSDNADFTMYFTNIIKWILLSAKLEFLKNNWENPTISISDLILEQEYKPQTIYSKTLTLTLQNDNLYIRDNDKLAILLDILENPNDYEEREPSIPTNIIDSPIYNTSLLLHNKSKAFPSVSSTNEGTLTTVSDDGNTIQTPVHFFTDSPIPRYLKEPNLSLARDIVHKESNTIVIPYQEQWIFSIIAKVFEFHRPKDITIDSEAYSIIEHDTEYVISPDIS